ncbi:MAG: cytidylate kinase family protein [Oscillospiraceae bacterium]|nr:cytidylate kinase family protein [Oscillospiraceae bacterium]
MAIITISRQMGSLGDEVAEALSSKLNWELITRKHLIDRFFADVTDAQQKHMLNESAKYYLTELKGYGTYRDLLEQSLFDLAGSQPMILVGFGSQVIFADDPQAVHVRIIAPEWTRLSRVRKQFHVSEEDAEQILSVADKKHKRFVSTVFGADLTDSSHYHITLNTAGVSVDECVTAIIALQQEHELLYRIRSESDEAETIDHMADVPVFHNPSEAEFARILDMYQIEWKYEPKTFPVEWDAEGNITLAFSPDFYLTKFDTYLELTTMSQKYVTEKNKKLKKVRELYPGTNIKIVYKKDFISLIERFKTFGGGNRENGT